MKKEYYQTPSIEVMQMESSSILAGSGEHTGIVDNEEDPNEEDGVLDNTIDTGDAWNTGI